MDTKHLNKEQINNLENYKIYNADGLICIKDFIHNTIKYRNTDNIMYNPVKCVYDRY